MEADERALMLRWEQQVAGHPVRARAVGCAETELRLEPAGSATKVTIELRQKLRGIFATWGQPRAQRGGQDA